MKKMIDENIDIETQKKATEIIKNPPKQILLEEELKKDNYWPITDLPSKFKLYPEGTKIFGRPLKVLEVKQLSAMDENNANYVTSDIISKSIKTFGIKIEDILSADKLYLLFWLRANTYKDSGYKLEFDCPYCQKESNYNFGLDKLDIKYISDTFDINETIELPESKDKLIYNYPRISDEYDLEAYTNAMKVSGTNIDEDILLLATGLKEVNQNKGMKLFEKYNYIINMNPMDYLYLMSYERGIRIGVVPFLKVKCSHCGGEAPIGVSFQDDFFVPKYKFGPDTRN